MAEAESRSPTFTDELERQLDSGFRVALPKDWRGPNVTEFFLISDSSSSFIKAFPKSEYEKFVGKIESDGNLDETTRNEHLEEFASSFKKAKVDGAGRMALPSELCDEIGIVGKNPTVTLKGAAKTFNIWNPAKLEERNQRRKKLAEGGKAPPSVKKFLGV